jgi:hypothetical protein
MMVPVHDKAVGWPGRTLDGNTLYYLIGRGASIVSQVNALVMNRDNPDPGPALLPGHFSFYLGSYSGGSCLVRWDGRSLIAEKTRGGNFSGVSRRYQPGIGQWEEFWRRADDLGIWSWDTSYSAPHGCCGVTYWQITLSRGAKTISSSGEDMFPDGVGQASSRVFIALIDAIKVLCRE